jgi:heme/copper-type cytochrome/quinol oxidase subunit 1
MKTPFIFLLIASILNALCGVFAGNEVFFLQVSRGIDLNHLRWIPPLSLFILGIVYWFLQKQMHSLTLTTIHVFTSIISISIFTIIPYVLAHYNQGLAGFPRRYYDVKPLFADYEPMKQIARLSFALALAAQILLFLNIIQGLRKKAKP